GSFSRIFAQKGFNVYFRKSYGMESLEYPLFGDAAVSAEGEPIENFESFCLRPGGNGTESLPFRDSLLQELLSDGAALTQISRPAIVFLNGEFYGVVCLNEKYSDAYFESHFGVDADNVVLIKDGEVDEGEDEDIELYDALQAYAERDLSDEAAWNEFSEVADTRSLADYFAAQICICNTDLQNERNILLWRSREVEDGNPYGDTRWRWILYDLDYTCGMYDQGSTPREHDIVGQYLDTIPLFAQAMRNADFRDMVRERLVELVEGPLGNTRAVEAFRTRWDAWKPWMEMGAKRFALDARMAEYDFAGIKVFFTGHAESILRIFDEHAAEL
ncbi:MAG: CotH kinase family protein, partial [Atopobiaceae bacterium]|nr:CotH kinase family protein [Atopobiaceae bacterium]